MNPHADSQGASVCRRHLWHMKLEDILGITSHPATEASRPRILPRAPDLPPLLLMLLVVLARDLLSAHRRDAVAAGR
jgi:hypothetical protein